MDKCFTVRYGSGFITLLAETKDEAEKLAAELYEDDEAFHEFENE